MARTSDNQPRPPDYPKNAPWPLTDSHITWDKTKGRFLVRLTFEGKTVLIGRYDLLSHARAARDRAKGEIVTKTFIPPVVQRLNRKASETQAQQKAERDLLTVQAWAKQWLARDSSTKGTPLSPGSVQTYRSCLINHVLPHLGDKPIGEVTRKDIDDLLAGRFSGKPPARNTAGTIRAMFKAAQQKGHHIHFDVLADVKVTKSAKRKTLKDDVVLSPNEVAAIARAMPSPYGLAVELAAWCLLRIGEVQALQRRDMDLAIVGKENQGITNVRRQWKPKYEAERRKKPQTDSGFPPGYAPPKNSSYGEIPIFNQDLITRVKGHLDFFVGPESTALLFPSTQTPGVPISEATLLKKFREAAVAAGITRPVDFHTLRHSGATWFGQTGATLAAIMKFGRWSDMESAMRYQHADRDALIQYGSRMSK
jgi:integrase